MILVGVNRLQFEVDRKASLTSHVLGKVSSDAEFLKYVYVG
ncbi:unnamed protein product [Brassica oleracea var. botrytis]|uniref:Uncharacterized protein n=2 Tax=Brassica TaxID=3705 RepID=A0A3P6DD60_BRAOL|nr:unnamed protein product [Brassica napus]CDY32572.1 BnaC02g17650D [Brassica napus]VDD22224.1 unnamed protein product [Brassica oleracea]